MFGITAQDINGVTYHFVMDTVKQVREFALSAKREFETLVSEATYDGQVLGRHDSAMLVHSALAWEHTGA